MEPRQELSVIPWEEGRATEALAPWEPLPPRPRVCGWRRWLMHGALFGLFAVVGGTLLVWPQWLAREGAVAALALQEREAHALEERIAALRSAAGPAFAPGGGGPGEVGGGRRVLLEEEGAGFPALVRAVASRYGAVVLDARVTERLSPRWQPLVLEPTLDPAEPPSDDRAREIRPQTVRLLLAGRFEAVYRTLAALDRQEPLFVIDRWRMAPRPESDRGGTLVQADVRGTVFVLREERDSPIPAGVSTLAGDVGTDAGAPGGAGQRPGITDAVAPAAEPRRKG